MHPLTLIPNHILTSFCVSDPIFQNEPHPAETHRRASGERVRPARRAVRPRAAHRESACERIALGVRVFSAGRGKRQAGRPRSPMHAVPLLAVHFHQDSVIGKGITNKNKNKSPLSRQTQTQTQNL